MAEPIVVYTSCQDVADFVARFAPRVTNVGIRVPCGYSAFRGERSKFEVRLADGSAALRGEGVVVDVRDGGEQIPAPLRYEVLIGSLSFDARNEVVYERIMMLRADSEGDPATGEVSLEQFESEQELSTEKPPKPSAPPPPPPPPGVTPRGGAPLGPARPTAHRVVPTTHQGITAGVTQPGVTQPGVTQPGVTQPGVTQPAVTLPRESPSPHHALTTPGAHVDRSGSPASRSAPPRSVPAPLATEPTRRPSIPGPLPQRPSGPPRPAQTRAAPRIGPATGGGGLPRPSSAPRAPSSPPPASSRSPSVRPGSVPPMGETSIREHGAGASMPDPHDLLATTPGMSLDGPTDRRPIYGDNLGPSATLPGGATVPGGRPVPSGVPAGTDTLPTREISLEEAAALLRDAGADDDDEATAVGETPIEPTRSPGKGARKASATVTEDDGPTSRFDLHKVSDSEPPGSDD